MRTDFFYTQIDVPLLYPKRSEEHTSELQSPCNLVCRLLLEKKKKSSTTPSRQVQPPSTFRSHDRMATHNPDLALIHTTSPTTYTNSSHVSPRLTLLSLPLC